ncbi:hypothetical protein K469DRAFT_752567 [Zopfia rhizophila CBS 207.26]|uniref:Subtelomeric hrmA-associated cluster protein AFUB-079030/YDR124W-like helical bundle domain-containing protein n=1 Tax=Zopfia rhizophila CBS 207.26 TaxID=1314779 RepID=A0A6A6DRK4_9PEZI|nr:hypothetical protein K469DRAFT_752567 [Zopfia rhizophila CBS 207.26]
MARKTLATTSRSHRRSTPNDSKARATDRFPIVIDPLSHKHAALEQRHTDATQVTGCSEATDRTSLSLAIASSRAATPPIVDPGCVRHSQTETRAHNARTPQTVVLVAERYGNDPKLYNLRPALKSLDTLQALALGGHSELNSPEIALVEDKSNFGSSQRWYCNPQIKSVCHRDTSAASLDRASPPDSPTANHRRSTRLGAREDARKSNSRREQARKRSRSIAQIEDEDEDSDLENSGGPGQPPISQEPFIVRLSEADTVERAFYLRFAEMGSNFLKSVLTEWVKIRWPKKRKYPYTKKGVEAPPPPGWPVGLRHVEPSHLKKHENRVLAISILRSYGVKPGWADALSKYTEGYLERFDAKFTSSRNEEFKEAMKPYVKKVVKSLFDLACYEDDYLTDSGDAPTDISDVRTWYPTEGKPPRPKAKTSHPSKQARYRNTLEKSDKSGDDSDIEPIPLRSALRMTAHEHRLYPDNALQRFSPPHSVQFLEDPFPYSELNNSVSGITFSPPANGDELQHSNQTEQAVTPGPSSEQQVVNSNPNMNNQLSFSQQAATPKQLSEQQLIVSTPSMRTQLPVSQQLQLPSSPPGTRTLPRSLPQLTQYGLKDHTNLFPSSEQDLCKAQPMSGQLDPWLRPDQMPIHRPSGEALMGHPLQAALSGITNECPEYQQQCWVLGSPSEYNFNNVQKRMSARAGHRSMFAPPLQLHQQPLSWESHHTPHGLPYETSF